MWECFSHDIYLLYLPPHSSHLTQPCDKSCFSVLKRAYRRLLGNLVLLTDSSPIGKKNFLFCYSEARKEGFTEVVIRSGWQAAGLWPICMTKVLASAQFLDPTKEEAKPTSEVPKSTLVPSGIEITTPLRSNQMLRQIRNRKRQSLGTRLLIRKIGKGLDANAMAIAQRDQRIRALELEVERLRPKKRMKVVPNPNERFVGIQQIARVQAEAAAAIAAEAALQDVEEEEEAQSCIWVANKV
jgi:hypothetical protein